jgi:hypothetical protein
MKVLFGDAHFGESLAAVGGFEDRIEPEPGFLVACSFFKRNFSVNLAAETYW